MSSVENAIKLYHAAAGGNPQHQRALFALLTSLILAIVIFIISRASGINGNYLPIFDFGRSFTATFLPKAIASISQILDFILFFAFSLLTVQTILRLNTSQDKTDVYTPLREAIAGDWKLSLRNFSSVASSAQLDCTLNLRISKNTEKLIAQFSSASQLDITAAVLNVGLSVSDNSIVEIAFIADQIIVVDGDDKDFKYLIQMKGAETSDGGPPQFQGAWYALEAIGAPFRSRGVASMVRLDT